MAETESITGARCLSATEWQVTSNDPELGPYRVTIHTEGLTCTCAANAHGRACRHMTVVDNLVPKAERQTRALATAIADAPPAPAAHAQPATGRRHALATIPVADLIRLGALLVGTGFLPEAIKSGAQAAAVMLKGQELGLPPMLSLEHIGIVKGRPSLSAALLTALVHQTHGPEALHVAETTPDRCTVEWRSPGWPLQTYTLTIQDAQRAGLLDPKKSTVWKEQPAVMLRYWTLKSVCRFAFPLAIMGMAINDAGPEVAPLSIAVLPGEPPIALLAEALPDDDEDHPNTLPAPAAAPSEQAPAPDDRAQERLAHATLFPDDTPEPRYVDEADQVRAAETHRGHR